MIHYPIYGQRPVHCLDGVWDLAFLGCDIDPEQIHPADIAFADRMAIPGVVDSLPSYRKQRGCYALRRTVQCQHTGRAGRLVVGGLGLWAKVIVDGQTVGTCLTPWAPWQVDIPASEATQRELIILIDSRIDPERVPLFDPYFDFYGYGGIFRSCFWHELPELAIERAAVLPQGLDGALSVELRLLGQLPAEVDVHFAIDSGEEQSLRLTVEQGVAHFQAQVAKPQTWSPQHPHLHTLSIRLDSPGSAGDSITERFGIRTLATAQGQVLLNGEPIKLLGYNRHEAHPQFGPALPLQQLVQDLQILRSLGCNYIRGSHYPQDQRFLDLCDEMGFVVWEEALGWQARKPHFASERFHQLQEAQTRAMVRTSINHPSVIMWGFLNECESHLPESEDLLARLSAAVRAEDSSRLLTFASNHPFEERNYHLVDVVAINQYPGWYPADIDKERPLDEIEPLIDRLLAHLAEQGQGDKPFIISEMGAGAIYGWRDELEGHWSEQYQAAYLDILCRRVVCDQRIAGLAIWQFCDCRTYSDGHALGRPRSFNNKGSFDEYRRPKMAAETVRRIFTQ
ncbi:MAG: beta-galactosidase [Planctomycetota bacterium]|nr:MAG: beta-galactosidase [Planctomycetota bacterium]